MTHTLGYTRFKANQPAGTHDDQTNNAGSLHDGSDSECDKQTIVVPFFPSNNFSGTGFKDASGMVESDSGYAEELARLQRQAHEAKEAAERFSFEFTKDTEELLR